MPFDVHLMIENPDQYIEAFAQAGADIITVHQEACTHLHRTIQLIHKCGCKAGVSLNPATDESTLKYILPDVDMVLLMSVNPGFGGQSYIHSVTKKIAAIRKMCDEMGLAEMDIEVDGGVDANTCKEVRDAGANVLVAGSAVYGAPDKAKIISILKGEA
jgi:ribulose-phosphate 3-epimerase